MHDVGEIHTDYGAGYKKHTDFQQAYSQVEEDIKITFVTNYKSLSASFVLLFGI